MSDAVVFVTGGSRGIGLSIVTLLLKDGHKVTSFARTRTPELEALASKYGSSFLIVQGDLANPTTARDAVQQTISKFGRVDSLILNASTIYPLKRLADSKLDDIIQSYQINVFSIIPVIQAALPSLRESKVPGGGRIIAVSSGAALKGNAGMGTYCSSKAALNILIGALGEEEQKVVSIAVNPGMVETQMAQEVRKDGKGAMADAVHGYMVSSFETGGNNHPDVPAKAIIALALRAGKDLSGQYFDFDSEKSKAVAAA